MPARYEKWLHKFTSNDEVNDEDHMSDFWAFFQLHPISDDVEDLAMKLFSVTLHDNARRWYDSLHDANITSMDQLEEVFLNKWSVKLEDIHMLIKRLDYIQKTENEIVKEFHIMFKNLLQQIPRSHCHEHKFLLFLYTDEGYQSHEEEQEFTHDSTKDNEDLVEEQKHEDNNMRMKC
jgi:hypothetical protein